MKDLLLLCLKIFCLLSLQLPTVLAAPLVGHRMMVATPTPLSAQIAEDLINKKGNVVDVAVGIALVLAVTNPRHAALGGGGFAMVKMANDPVQALDFREVAPEKTHPQYYLNKKKKDSYHGPHAIGVPGLPAGLWSLHKKYGKLHWSQLFDKPIELAQKGHHITGENVDRSVRAMKHFNPAGKKYFLGKDGQPFKPGELVKQKQLAKALKLMRNRGTTPFYKGDIADDIVDTIKKAGGVLSSKDLRDYKVKWRKPITTQYKGHKLYLMPPPSSAGLIITASLKMFEELKLDKKAPLSTDELHSMAEVMKINFRNRNLLGDPDFTKNPSNEFLDDKKIKSWTQKISPNKPLQLKPINFKKWQESNQTTHFSVLDSQGNAVAMTITLNGVFGSKIVTDKYGIALNNEMNDFTTRPGEPNIFGLVQGEANLVKAGARPLSSMAPTLVAKNNKVVMALGAPGGPRIITGVLSTLYRVLANGYNMEEAIHAPRVHHQFLPDILFVDNRKLPPLSIEALKKLGHEVKASWHSRVNGVRVNEKGFLEAAFDYRSEGGAGGY